MRYIEIVLIMASVLGAGVAPATAGVTVELVSGDSKTGDVLTIGGGQVTLKTSGGDTVGQWAVGDVARADFGRDAATPTGEDLDTVRVVGGILRGHVESFDGNAFKVTGTDFGDINLPTAAVEAVIGVPAAAERVETAPAPTDVVILKNFDRLVGTLNGMDKDKLKFHSDLGDLDLERGRVAALKMASPAAGRPKGLQPVLRVTLPSGTAVELSSVEVAAGTLKGTLAGGPAITVPVEKVLAIEIIGGRLALLETLEPAVYEQQSLDVVKWEIKRGQNVLGQPMRLRSADGKTVQTHVHGLGVHGPCRIVYKLDGPYERFIALAGIDESAGRLADANLVVKVDGREAFRADHVKWQEPPKAINVPVAGAKELELIVEVGENFDIQSRIDWAEARLIRAGAAK